jgi:hypothetical protein
MAAPCCPDPPTTPQTTVHPVVTKDAMCVGGIRLHGVGIRDDPIPGSKQGKGLPHHNSSYWVHDLGTFIDQNLKTLVLLMQDADAFPGGARVYFLNQSNAWFMRADTTGLRTNVDGIHNWMMASWLAMMAAECDSFPFSKYTAAERRSRRDDMWKAYIQSAEHAENDRHTVVCRVDLIPPTAFERLSLHNELSALKYGDHALDWKNKGFVISARIDSVKRHLDQAHNMDHTEDHMAHLIWNFMAIFHVLTVFPHLNDVVDYEALREKNSTQQHQQQHQQHLAYSSDPWTPKRSPFLGSSKRIRATFKG